jgi:alanine dehydrogenase
LEKKPFSTPTQELAMEASMLPEEKAAPIKKSKNLLYIGIPKEITYQENRTPLTPSAIEYLVNNGHKIVIESNAGKASNFPDIQYANAGAKILKSKEEIYKADLILKIDPPTHDEVDMMKQGQIIISALQLKELCPVMLNKLMQKKVNSIGYEFLEDESGSLPVIRAMSELAGHASILIAAEYLNNSNIGKGELLGGFMGIPPTQIVIIGAGAVGEYATRAALGLGAAVQVFDNDLYRLRRLQDNIGSRIYTSTIHPKILAKALSTCDVAIGALRTKGRKTPMVVTEEMVMNMKPKSVIIDVAIDQGGVFETSMLTNHEKPIFRKHEVLHYCVPNIPSRVSRTASYGLSNIFTPLLMDLAEFGDFNEYIKIRKGVRKGVYIYNGQLTNASLGEKFNLRFKDLDLLLGTFLS